MIHKLALLEAEQQGVSRHIPLLDVLLSLGCDCVRCRINSEIRKSRFYWKG